MKKKCELCGLPRPVSYFRFTGEDLCKTCQKKELKRLTPEEKFAVLEDEAWDDED